MVTTKAKYATPSYFGSEASLFPKWPVFDAQKALILFCAAQCGARSLVGRADEFPGARDWAGSCRQCQVGENDVRLEVTLPWLLHKFGQVIQKTIAGKGQILLEKKDDVARTRTYILDKLRAGLEAQTLADLENRLDEAEASGRIHDDQSEHSELTTH